MRVQLENDELATPKPSNKSGDGNMADTKEKEHQHKQTTVQEHSGTVAKTHKDGEEVETLVASTNLIGDATTLLGMTPTAASVALATNPNGPLQDISGNVGLVLNHFKEAAALLKIVNTVTDAADTDKAKFTGVVNALTGGGSPSGTLLADMASALATAPTAASAALAISPNGPIIDAPGSADLVNLMLKEAKMILALVNRVMDASDPMKTIVGNLSQALV